LLLSGYPVTGVHYAWQMHAWESQLFYHAWMERSDYQKDDIRLAGFAEIVHLSRGRVGILYVNDHSRPFADASRDAVSGGPGWSLQADWETSAYWHVQAELAHARGVGAALGVDVPLLDFLPWQLRVRYQDEGFAPLLGWYTREAAKQAYFYSRFPFHFYSEQLILAPEWGLKHTPERNYWLPGLKLQATLWDRLWLHFRMAVEQPMDEWGAYGHYEYTEAKCMFMIDTALYVDVRWSKTFNGFLDWKETKSQAGVEFKW